MDGEDGGEGAEIVEEELVVSESELEEQLRGWVCVGLG